MYCPLDPWLRPAGLFCARLHLQSPAPLTVPFSPTRRSAPRRRAGPGGGLRPVPAAPPASPARRTARGRGGRPVAPPNVVTSLARESFAQNCARISWAGCSHRRVPQPIGGKLGTKGAPRTPTTTLEAAPPSSPRSGGAAPTHGAVAVAFLFAAQQYLSRYGQVNPARSASRPPPQPPRTPRPHGAKPRQLNHSNSRERC